MHKFIFVFDDLLEERKVEMSSVGIYLDGGSCVLKGKKQNPSSKPNMVEAAAADEPWPHFVVGHQTL